MSNKDLYSKLLYRTYNLKHWIPKEIHNLNNIIKAADYLKINYNGTFNFQGKYVDKYNLKKNTQYVHVTGTNGKGSVTKKIDKALSLAGIKTGRFTSPHICSFLERITINTHNLITKDYVERRLNDILNCKDNNKFDISFFDTLTLLMLDYFQNQNVEIALVEVGCGGILDSTNIINPLISIVTTIGYDHMNVLGYTKREISKNKSGIFKLNTPALIGPNVEPIDVFVDKAKELNCDLSVMKNADVYNESFEEENKAIAKQALIILREKYDKYLFGGRLTDEIINEGIKIKQDCRMEDVIEKVGMINIININKSLNNYNRSKDYKLKVFLDVAHNEQGLNKVFKQISYEYPDYYIRVVCGFSGNKDIESLMKIILSNVNKVYFGVSDNHRLLKEEEYFIIIKKLKEQFVFKTNNSYYQHQYIDITNPEIDKDYYTEDIISTKNVGSIDDTIKKCFKEICYKKEIVLITGSFFIMKDARLTLGYNDFCDPFIIMEK